LPPTRPRVTRGRQASFGALGDQRPLELGDSAEHLQGEHPLRRRRVDGIAQAAEVCPAGLELLDDGEQMADRTGEAVKPDHDQGFASGNVAQQPCQHRTAAIGTRSVLLEYGGAAGGRAVHRIVDQCLVPRWRLAHSQ
jgi:hypothetical protein